MEYVECITDMVAWFTPVWEEIQYNDGQASSKERLWLHWAGEMENDGGQEWLLICACLWHLNLPYRSHDLLQVTDLKIQGEKQWYSYSMLWNSTATNQCNACVAKIGLYLRNQSCSCHDLKWDMCVGVLSTYPNLFLVNSISGCSDIHLSLQHVQTLHQLYGPLHILSIYKYYYIIIFLILKVQMLEHILE